MRTIERYRISVFGKPRSPWRASVEDAMRDAIALELASWDGERRCHYLAVPVDLDVERTRVADALDLAA